MSKMPNLASSGVECAPKTMQDISVILFYTLHFRVQSSFKPMMISHKNWKNLEAWQIVRPTGIDS